MVQFSVYLNRRVFVMGKRYFCICPSKEYVVWCLAGAALMKIAIRLDREIRENKKKKNKKKKKKKKKQTNRSDEFGLFMELFILVYTIYVT